MVQVIVRTFTKKPRNLAQLGHFTAPHAIELGSHITSNRPATNLANSVNINDVIDKLDSTLTAPGDISPYHCHIDVRVFIPNVTLDLYYNIVEGDHLLFDIDTLQTQVILRPHDFQVLCRFNALSIQDSLRSAAQQNLLKTLDEDVSQVQVSYTAIHNAKSPHFSRYPVSFNSSPKTSISTILTPH